MELTTRFVRWTGAPRLVPSRYPSVGLLDRVASPSDLDALFELENWTNDRINVELGLLRTIPPHEWVTGRPMSSVIMAAFCHPRHGGGRFSFDDRGAWYAARAIETALAESIYHRTAELREVGGFETRVEMRVYLADFNARFVDVRATNAPRALYDPDSYVASQRFARSVIDSGGNGIVYRSVRHAGGQCVACFRPALIRNVRVGGHYELRWSGRPAPSIRKL